LELADFDGFVLVVDQCADLLRQPGTVLLEPARSVLFVAEVEQAVAFLGGDPADTEERGDI
jgi:hypothetical protein